MSIDRAIRDARNIVTKGGFNTSIVLTPVGDIDPITIQGVTSRHHIEFNQDGYPVNATNAHILLSENDLKANGLITRDTRGNVALDAWLASWVDGTGESRTYKIVQTKPSETLGLIICTVGRYGTN